MCVGDKLAEEEEGEQVAGADDRPETSDDECDWSLDASTAAQAFPSSLHTLLRALSVRPQSMFDPQTLHSHLYHSPI